MHSILNHLRVLDFGQYMAGPLAAMLLADQGADVIRIDPPEGPRWNTPANATWNRNKRSITLNLKNDRDVQIARQLVCSADVLIENFRPGVMHRLGLGWGSCRELNPKLIYCSLPGFGSTDPRAHIKAWEGILGAATATYAPRTGGKRPIYTVIPYSSAFGAFLCVVSVAAALNARDQIGEGQWVEIPLFDSTFASIGAKGLLVNGKPAHEREFSWNDQLLCKDGRWFFYDGNNKKLSEFLEKTGMARWRDTGLSSEELKKKFQEMVLMRTAQEWDDFCAEIGTEGVTCHSSAEWLTHPQALASQIIADFEDPQLGRFRGPGINVRLSRTPGGVRSPRPTLNAHRQQILQELAAHNERAIQPTVSDLRAAFDGTKVLDLCIVLAGPTCGRTFAEFGADVIKIDSPHVQKVLRHNDVNRGKRSILLDLKTEEGLDVFWRLVDWADVVLQNFRNGVAEKLGIDYEAVRARRPDIIYASINTYGQAGPFAGRPGHESIAQAATGMQLRFGSHKPALAPFAGNDYGTGLMGCFGVALALLHRRRTGEGQFVDTALAYTATILQSHLMQEYAGKVWDEPHGQNALGSSPLCRAYEASDGWIFIAGSEDEFARCTEFSDIAGKNAHEFEQQIEARIKMNSRSYWLTLLHKSDIGAHSVVLDLTQLMNDPIVQDRGLSVTRDHEGFGPITTTAPSIHMSRTPPRVGRPAPKPGSDAESILSEIGMKNQLERLVEKRVLVLDGVMAGC